jgi:hypothetical protein
MRNLQLGADAPETSNRVVGTRSMWQWPVALSMWQWPVALLLLALPIAFGLVKRRPPSTATHAQSAAETVHHAAIASGLAKGDRVKVFWPAMDKWYAGTIKGLSFQDGAEIHRIRYDDQAWEWRALGDARWERLPALPSRPAASPVRRVVAETPARPRPKMVATPDFTPSDELREFGYEMHEGLLDESAMETLRDMTLGNAMTKPINGEAARRQRPLEANNSSHTRVLRCLDDFLGARGILASEPSVLYSRSDARRQRAHRDRGHGSLIMAFHEGTHLWVAPGSHLQPTSDPSAWEHCLRRVDIPTGCAVLFDPALVHAGGDASCPPRVHSYTLARGRERSPADVHSEQAQPMGSGARLSLPMRGDFGEVGVR